MTEIQWFVIVKGRQQGPYSANQLLKIKGVTPDTLAWKEGMKKWKPIRAIPELQDIFEDRETKPPIIEEVSRKKEVSDDLVLTFPFIEPPWIFWLIFLILISFYVIFRFFLNT